MKRVLTLVTLSGLPGLALAHGDHGASIMSSLTHILGDAWHLLPLVAVGLLILVAKKPLARVLSKQKRRD